MDVTCQLKTLTELLEGESNNPDMVDETSETEEEDISGWDTSCADLSYISMYVKKWSLLPAQP